MKYALVILFWFCGSVLFAQTPAISWQKTIGGSSTDVGTGMVEMSNGHFVICANSSSNISGEKVENSYGNSDYWVYELDSFGNIVWQKTFGGSDGEAPQFILKTSDGGFLVLGTSFSDISGNKTVAQFGNGDLWLIKLMADGTEEWQKGYGGDLSDRGIGITDLNNGTLMVYGTSKSGLTGNKTVDSKGGADYWILHIDNVGNIINQFTLGGSNNDFLRSVSVYPNNRLLISGYSGSDISGDKQENSFGSLDYWVLITDFMGNVEKSETVGGSLSEFNSGAISTVNKGVVMFGHSSSPTSGNKSSGNNGMSDYWVVNLDSNLDVIWDVSFGGDDEEDASNNSSIYFSPTSSMVFGGTSWSGISGNKDLASFGDKDYWIVGIDSNGIKEFEFVAGGSSQELFGQIIQTTNNTVMVLGGSWSGISGNKTEESRGFFDVWQFELDFNVGIEKIYSNNELKAFPVPATTVLNFAIPMKGIVSNINLTDITGNVVYSGINSFGENEQINISNYPPGIYVLSVISDKFHYTRKIVIE